MNTVVGIIKEIDKLGRIVIPKEFRERFALTETVEIIATEFGVIIRNPEYKLVKMDIDETNNGKVITTSETGGLHSPYKGQIQASSLKGTTEV